MKINILFKKYKIFGCFILVFCLNFFILSYAKAIPSVSDILASQEDLSDEEKEEIEEEYESLSEKADKYRKMIELKQKQQNTLANQLKLIELRTESIENNISLKKKEIGENEEKMEEIEKEMEKKEEEISSSKEQLSEILRTFSRIENEMTLEFISSKGDLTKIFNKSGYLNQASQKVQESLEEVEAKKEELNKKKKEFMEEKDTLEENKKELETQAQYLNNEKYTKGVILEKTKGEEAKYQKLLADIENEIYELEADKTVDYDNIPPAKKGYFDYPVKDIRITQGYGMTSFAKAGAYNGKPHNGIDFGVNYESVYAVRDGKVLESGNNRNYAYGQWLAIDHGDGLVTLYGHLSSKKVGKGEKVKKGEKIGASGNTGYSTGPHLHFSVFDKKSFGLSESKYISGLMIPNGASINPMRYLDQKD